MSSGLVSMVLVRGVYWRQFVSPLIIRLQSTIASETSSNVKSFDDIPGPRGPPYFGTYFQYKLGTIDPHKTMDTLKHWHGQYGSIVKETLLGHTVIHVFDPEAVQTVYANEDKWPRIEPLAETTQLYRLKTGMSPGLGNSNDEEWYRIRSAVQQLMMRQKEVEKFLPSVDPVSIDFVDRIKKLRDSNKEVPDFASELGRWSLETAGMNAFGMRLGYLTEESGLREAKEVVEANRLIFELNSQLKVSLPFYKLFHTPKWKKLFAAEDLLIRVLRKHLNQALAKLNTQTSNNTLKEDDFLFLRYMLTRKELSNVDITTIALSLFTDGLSTTSQQLQFTLYLLATNSDAQEKAYQEVSAVASCSPASLTAQSINQLTYIRACIKESLRMLPMINEVSRVTKKDMVLCGYRIPAGTSLHLDNHVLYRHRDYFPQPDAFLPDRWLRNETCADPKPHPFIVLPFGHGSRMCAGRRFAEQDMAVLLTRILQNFRLEWHHPPMGLKYMTLNVPDCPARYTFIHR